MKTKALYAITALIIWSLSCGCVTKQLWQDAEYNESSPTPNLRLYYSEAKRDILVSYDELGSNSAVTRRGYYLLKNSSRLSHSRKPVFVDVRQTNQLKQVPVYFKGTITPPQQTICAIAETNANTFQLIVNTNETETHQLPIYPSPLHRTTQILLTPPAVVADTVIAGSVVGIIAAYYWAGSGAPGVH